MITDDQVAALLRDAGNDGPLPRPLDPSDAKARAGRGRTRTQALSGLGVALAAVLILTEPGRVLLTAAAGGSQVPSSPGVRPSYLAPILLALVVLAAGLATPFARRLREDAVPRRLLAALWGVLALLLAGPFSDVAGWLFAPSHWGAVAGTRFASPWVGLWLLVPAVLAAGPLLGRRTLRATAIRPVSGALWLALTLGCGWSLGWLALEPVSNPAQGSAAVDIVGLAAALAVAVAVGAAARRRLTAGSPWRRSSGATLVVVAVTAATTLAVAVPPALSSPTRMGRLGSGWLVLAAVVLAVLAIVGARWTLDASQRSWLTAVLAVAVVPLSLRSGNSILSAMAADPRTGVVHPASGLIWGGVLAVLAVAVLAVVDRRTAPAPIDSDVADGTDG